MKKILFVVNVDWFFISHRLPIALAAKNQGYSVHIACAFTGKELHLKSMGFHVHEIEFSRSGKNFLKEATTIYNLMKITKKIGPDILHCITIKPVLYSGIVARALGLNKVVFAISGLGSVFVAQGVRSTIRRYFVTKMYRFALNVKKPTVIFQNTSDKTILRKLAKLTEEECVLIKGSGVDLDEYHYSEESNQIPNIVMASRLLKEKGVYDFVTIAKNLKGRGIKANFLLIGEPDQENPSSITECDLQKWKSENHIQVMGFQKDIPHIFSKSHIIIHPSFYGEGIPKVLIEAAACGRAVITTDNPGCAEAIIPNHTGICVPIGDVAALENATEELIKNSALRKKFGRAGRALAEKEYDIKIVVKQHLDIYEKLSKSE